MAVQYYTTASGGLTTNPAKASSVVVPKTTTTTSTTQQTTTKSEPAWGYTSITGEQIVYPTGTPPTTQPTPTSNLNYTPYNQTTATPYTPATTTASSSSPVNTTITPQDSRETIQQKVAYQTGMPLGTNPTNKLPTLAGVQWVQKDTPAGIPLGGDAYTGGVAENVRSGVLFKGTPIPKSYESPTKNSTTSSLGASIAPPSNAYNTTYSEGQFTYSQDTTIPNFLTPLGLGHKTPITMGGVGTQSYSSGGFSFQNEKGEYGYGKASYSSQALGQPTIVYDKSVMGKVERATKPVFTAIGAGISKADKFVSENLLGVNAKGIAYAFGAEERKNQYLYSNQSVIPPREPITFLTPLLDKLSTKYPERVSGYKNFMATSGEVRKEIFIDYSTKPVSKIGIPLAVGYGFGVATTSLASIGTKTATAVDLGGKGLLSLYVVSKGTQFVNAKELKTQQKIVLETGIETGLFMLGGSAGSETAIRLGANPQPSAVPKLTFESSKVHTTKEDIVIGRNIGWVQPSTGKGGNIIGYRTSIKAEVTNLGTGQKVTNLKDLPFSVPEQKAGIYFGKPREGSFKPEVLGEGTFITLSSPSQRDIVLSLSSIPKSERMDLSSALKLGARAKSLKTNLYTETIPQPKSFSSRTGADYSLKTLGDIKTPIGKQATTLYGSTTISPRIRQEYLKWIGESGDYDYTILKGEKFTSDLAKSLSSSLTGKFKESAFITADKPTTIQARTGLKDNPTMVKVDLHSYEGSGEVVQESFFGINFNQPKQKIGKYGTIPLSESFVRSASSSFTPRFKDGVGSFAPEVHREKDILRMIGQGLEFSALGKTKYRFVESYAKKYESLITSKSVSESKASGYTLPSPQNTFSGFVGLKETSLSLTSTKSSPSPKQIISPSPVIKSSPVQISKYSSPSQSDIPSPPSPYSYSSPSSSPSLYSSPSPSPSLYSSPSPSPSPSLYSSPSTPGSSPSAGFGFSLGGVGYGGRNIFNKRTKQKKGYTPTIFAIQTGLKGKRSKLGELTGLGARPIRR